MDGWAGLQAWAAEYQSLIALVGVFIGALGVFASFSVGAKARDGIPSLGETLQDRASWPELISRWRSDRGSAYEFAAGQVLAFADHLYGPDYLSLRAFARCLQLALIYPVLAILLGWLSFNTHSPAGMELFVETPLHGQRWLQSMTLLGAIALCALILANAQWIPRIFNDSYFDDPDIWTAHPDPISRIGRAVVDSILGAVTGLFAGAAAIGIASAFVVAGAFSFSFSASVFLAVVLTFSFVFAGAFAFAFSISAIATIIGIVMIYFGLSGINGPRNLLTLALLLYVFLPLLNAVADWISLAITRNFLRTHPARQHRELSITLLRACADLLLAFACLAGLLAAMTYGLRLWAMISPTTLPFTAADYMAQVIADPTQGTALYLMVTTTLLPTFVHFLLGLGAVLSHRGHLLARVADTLEAKLAANAPLNVIERHDLVGQIRLARWAGYGAALIITIVIFAAVILPIWWMVFG